MTPESSIDGVSFTLDCYGTPVRVFMFEGCPWFEGKAICGALGLTAHALDSFEKKALDNDIALHVFDTEPTYVLSPIGIWKMSHPVRRPLGPKIASWSKREAAKLVPTPTEDDARQRLTLNEDGSRPDYPDYYSGRLAEWKALQFHPNYKTANAIVTSRLIADMRAKMANGQSRIDRASHIASPQRPKSAYAETSASYVH